MLNGEKNRGLITSFEFDVLIQSIKLDSGSRPEADIPHQDPFSNAVSIIEPLPTGNLGH
jgi:hypothetical protein